MRKPIRLASICVVTILTLAGCSGNNAPVNNSSPPAQATQAFVPDANKVQVILSSELMPTDPKWWSDPPDESRIKYKLDR